MAAHPAINQAPGSTGAAVRLTACRARAGCPNSLIPVAQWQGALAEWLRESAVEERYAAKLPGGGSMPHQRLSIVIAGCPNGCSRPQIADLAICGAARPDLHPELCDACGSCVQACPDDALSFLNGALAWDYSRCLGCHACARACPNQAALLGPAWARVYMGGKLGRRPHLADLVEQTDDPNQAIARFSQAVDQYLMQAAPGERFSAWWPNRRKGEPI